MALLKDCLKCIEKSHWITFSIPCVFEFLVDEGVCGLIPSGRCVADAVLIGQQHQEDLHGRCIRSYRKRGEE